MTANACESPAAEFTAQDAFDDGLCAGVAADPVGMARKGISLCRQERWQLGLQVLSAVAESGQARARLDLQKDFHSYLGLATAMVTRRYGEALRLCRASVRRNFHVPDNHANMARLYLLIGEEGKAYRALLRGLQLAPDHALIHGLLRAEFPKRRSAVLPFVARNHPANILLGRLRHEFLE